MKKNLIKLLSLAIFSIAVMTLQSCDPDPCNDVVCQNNGECFDGSCICPDGFGGNNCETDLCADVTCNNGGECNNGTCDCAPGYSGTNCDVEQRTIFFGSYDASEVCQSDTSFVDVYLMDIVTTANAANEFLIGNIYNFQGLGIPAGQETVRATVTSDTTFDILEQSLSGSVADFVVVGSGSITGTTVRIDYTIVDTTYPVGDPNREDSCVATLTPR